MTVTPLAVTALAIAGSLSWTTASMLRLRRIDDLRNRIQANRATSLFPFVESIEHSNISGDELWEAIGGMKGIFEIHAEAGVILHLAINISKRYPENAKRECEEVLWGAVRLQLLTIGCMKEHLVKRFIPCWPRVDAHSFAKLYCDIITSLDVIFSLCDTASAANIS